MAEARRQAAETLAQKKFNLGKLMSLTLISVDSYLTGTHGDWEICDKCTQHYQATS